MTTMTVSPRGRETRHSSAWIADIRMIAMAIEQITSGDVHRTRIHGGMEKIIAVCEDLIAAGPAEFHHVIERSAPLAAIERELKRTAYPRYGER